MMKVHGFHLARCAKMDKSFLHRVRQFEDLHHVSKGIHRSLNDELKGKPCVLNEKYFEKMSKFTSEDLEYFERASKDIFTRETTGLTIQLVIESTSHNQPTLVVRLVDSMNKQQCVSFDCIDLI